jgi:hypothetical protein
MQLLLPKLMHINDVQCEHNMTTLYQRFHPEGAEGRLFKHIYLKGGYGIQKILAKRFNIGVGAVYHLRKRLGLPDLFSKDHPYNRRLLKRIKHMYLWEDKSTEWIGHVLHMHPENIRKKLHAMGVEMRPAYVTNPLYFPFKKAQVGHMKILKQIKDLHEKGFTVEQIGKELHLDAGAVSKKLKGMGIKVWRSGGKRVLAGYPCVWCGRIMDYVNVSTGPKKQLYCSTRCVSYAKEYRKYIRGVKTKYGPEALKAMRLNVAKMPEERKELLLLEHKK